MFLGKRSWSATAEPPTPSGTPQWSARVRHRPRSTLTQDCRRRRHSERAGTIRGSASAGLPGAGCGGKMCFRHLGRRDVWSSQLKCRGLDGPRRGIKNPRPMRPPVPRRRSFHLDQMGTQKRGCLNRRHEIEVQEGMCGQARGQELEEMFWIPWYCHKTR